MRVTVHCSECPTGEEMDAAHENERIVCVLPSSWGFALFDIVMGKESMDVVLCPSCKNKAKTRWTGRNNTAEKKARKKRSSRGAK